MKKEFPLAAVLSLTTGRLLGDFSVLHELIEHIAGHPVWTHEMADRALMDSLRDDLLTQHPTLSNVDATAVDTRNWEAHLDRWIGQYGATLFIEGGTYRRSESPIESARRLMPTAKVIALDISKLRRGDHDVN